jgi:hypothetical protein
MTWHNEDHESNVKNGKLTVCVVAEQGNMKGSYVRVDYFVNEKRYRIREGTYFSSYEYIPVGEKYMLLYDSIDPQRSHILFEQPVFVVGEVTALVSGKVEQITDRNVIEYSYTVDGNAFQRFQKLPDSVIAEEGRSYTVEYLAGYPLRSIIRIK